MSGSQMHEMMADHAGRAKAAATLGYAIGASVVLWTMIGCVVYLLV